MTTWILLLAYLVGTAWLGYLGAQRTTDLRSFALGDGRMNPWVAGFALAASMTSTATFLINPGIVWAYGLSALLGYGLAAGTGLTVGIVVLSKGFRRHGLRQKILTVPSWLAERYGTPALAPFFALTTLLILAMVTLICYSLAGLAVVVLGLGPVLGEHALPIVLAVVVAFVFAYTLAGGTYAHAYTNTLQGILMAVAAVVLLASGAHLLGPGTFERLAAIDPGLVAVTRPDSLLFRNLFEVFGVNLLVGFALAVQPHFLVKALYVESEKKLHQYLWIAAVLGAVFTSLLLCGVYARLGFGAEIAADLARDRLGIDGVMPAYLVRAFSEPVRALLSVAILAAGMSTLDGILVVLSSVVAHDLAPRLVGRPELQAQQGLAVGRWTLVACGFATFGLGLLQHQTKTLSIALFAQDGVYALFAATCLPVLFGLFPGRLPRGGAVLLSAVVALGIHFGMRWAKVSLLTEADWTNPGLTTVYALVGSAVVLGGDLVVRRGR